MFKYFRVSNLLEIKFFAAVLQDTHTKINLHTRVQTINRFMSQVVSKYFPHLYLYALGANFAEKT